MKIRFKNTGKAISWLIRCLCGTLSFEIIDHAKVLRLKERPRLVWIFWHNRMLVVPYLREVLVPDTLGCILASPSGDGQVIADVCAEFRLETVRGSSSRKGLAALMAMAGKMEQGYDVAITPDGPRGPCYHLNPGPVKLAQLTGAHILPISVQYERALTFNTWDKFQFPVPFSKVRVTYGETIAIPRRLTEEEFEMKRLEVEQVMRAGNAPY